MYSVSSRVLELVLIGKFFKANLHEIMVKGGEKYGGKFKLSYSTSYHKLKEIQPWLSVALR